MYKSTNNYLILDIETIPAPDWDLFQPDDLKQCPDFDMNSVKRLKKDADEDYELKQNTAKLDHINKFNEKVDAWMGKRSLRPLTGQVAVIGYYESKGDFFENFYQSENVTEKEILDITNVMVQRSLMSGYDIIGFNIKKFDLPFLTLRGLKYGIKPAWRFDDRYNKQIKDIAEYFQQGNYDWKFPKCNDVFKYFGLEEKLADGSEFGKLWETDKEKALEYNKDELIKLEKVARIIYYD